MDENRIRNSSAPTLQGDFLVADPKLSHSAFEQSVILVLQDDHHGTFGVVLNQMSSSHLGDGLSSGLALRELHNAAFRSGVEMSLPIFAIHQSKDLADIEISEGIFLSAESSKLDTFMHQISVPYRIVFGVVGWEKEEIRSEIAQGFWCPMSAAPEQIFGDPQTIWRDCWKRRSRERFAEVVGELKFPPHPQCN
ncbi:MAG: YqgE/AlgH family protein [Mariniblastus sp.]|nr:YqgE/AlgH family protein [Mariniblastus sp.]